MQRYGTEIRRLDSPTSHVRKLRTTELIHVLFGTPVRAFWYARPVARPWDLRAYWYAHSIYR